MRVLLIIMCGLLLNLNSSGQDMNYVKEQARILSSAKMKGRGYVDRGLECAARHISKEFKNLGLEKFGKDYFQSFVHSVNTFPGRIELTIDQEKQRPGIDFLVDPSSPQFRGRLTAKVFKGDDLNLLPQPKELQELCVDCILVLDMRSVEDKRTLKEAMQIKYLYSEYAPVIWLSDSKMTWAVSDRQLKFPVIESSEIYIEDGSTVELKVDARLQSNFESKNIIGYVPGKKDQDSLLVFTAHYDHLGMMGKEACFFGANDNASGTAFILSLAKHYVENPPEYTCVFIAFAAEEAGLKGSKFFVENPYIDLSRIRLVVNLDLMGSGIDGITVVNAKENQSEFDLMQNLNEKYDLLPLIKARGQAANSDHYYFAEAGVPAVFIYALGGSKAYHDVNDVNANLTFDEYSDIFKLLTHLVDKL